MYVEDQDEEVEEEEEFHEVEEEKHKTSQESVGSSTGDRSNSTPSRKPASSLATEKSEEKPTDEKPRPDVEASIASVTIESETIVMNSSNHESNPESKEIDDSKEITSTHSSPKTSAATQPASVDESATDLIHHEIFKSEEEISDQLNKPVDVVDSSDATSDLKPTSVAEQKPAPANDWANIMLNSESKSPESHEIKEPNLEICEPQDSIDKLVEQTTNLKLSDDSLRDGASSTQTDQHDQILNRTDSELKPSTDTTEDANDETQDQKSEEAEKKELDLDEDEENPQYIPKKGDFYEHDDRSHNIEDGASAKKDDDGNETKDVSASKKSLNQEKPGDVRRSNRRQRIDADRWNHDLFRDEKHKPKNNNTHGFEGRQQQERNPKTQNDGRPPRVSNATGERTQAGQESRSRTSRDGRNQRQNQTSSNRSRERKPRRQNNRSNRSENNQANYRTRESNNRESNSRSKPDAKDGKEAGSDEKQTAQPLPQISSYPNSKNDYDNRDVRDSKNVRNDSRGRRRTSRDRPTNPIDDLPPPNTVMPPITTWSNEDMVKAEAFSKDSPPRQQSNQATSTNNLARNRPTDYWSQGQPTKNIYQDRQMRNSDENRNQSYNARGRFQDRGEDMHRLNQFATRNHFNDRQNHNNQDWHRGNNSYGKPNDYIVKTQTFENSRLSQANRSNNRDLRDVLNERRLQTQQQNFPNKPTQGVDSHPQQRSHVASPQYHQYGHSPISHQSHMVHQHQVPHVLHQQQQLQQAQQQAAQQSSPIPTTHQQLRTHQAPLNKQPSVQSNQQPSPSTQAHAGLNSAQQHIQHQRAPNAPQTGQTRHNALVNNLADNPDGTRIAGTINSNDPLNSRPIIKTDSYTGTTSAAPPAHQQGPPIMSQNHRTMATSMAHHHHHHQQQQQGPNPATSHILPTHLGTSGIQTQYYTPTNNARDPATALASAYHGYIPGGHTMMDSAARYHMTTQQMSEHGYMTSPGQASDVASGPVLHQQSMYADTTAGGTVASSAYMAQAGSTLSSASNIPVTGGTGAHQPMQPVSYLQHSQYPPPPYSNPYSQHQHNQPPPPHSGQAYPPYWTYMS